MTRTIDFLRHKETPIMGLVPMMDGYLCPSCGLVTRQLLSPKLAMEKLARDCGVPFLISIPPFIETRTGATDWVKDEGADHSAPLG